jgi:hypothetical protein
MAFLLFSTVIMVPKSKRTLASELPLGQELALLPMNHREFFANRVARKAGGGAEAPALQMRGIDRIRQLRTLPSIRGSYTERVMPADTKALTFGSVNFRDPRERYLFHEQMGKWLQANRDAAIRGLQQKGIIDAEGRLIERTLPPDMRSDSDTDFGG